MNNVYVELVKENSDGKPGVNYACMVPVLLEAIKEQQKQNEKSQKEYEEQKVKIGSQQELIEKQQKELNELKKIIQQLINANK